MRAKSTSDDYLGMPHWIMAGELGDKPGRSPFWVTSGRYSEEELAHMFKSAPVAAFATRREAIEFLAENDFDYNDD